MKGFTSKSIHGDISRPREIHGSLRTPIYESSSFDYETADDLAKAFSGEVPGYTYSRLRNPTVCELEDRFAYLAGAKYGACFSSGMAAVSSILMAILSAGENLVTTRHLFGNTLSLLSNTLKSFNVETRFVDGSDVASFENAIDKNTRLILVESIANPQISVYELKKIGEICKQKGIVYIVDNTLLTPYAFDVKTVDADIEIVSTTKSVSGGATCIGGVALLYESDKFSKIPKIADWAEKVGNDALWFKLRKEIQRNIGASMSPNTAYLQLLGMETLALRMQQSCNSALKAATYLENAGLKVRYAGLESSPFHNNAKILFTKGLFGSLLLVEFENRETAMKFVDATKLFRTATNFCDNKSLIIHPRSTILCGNTDEEIKAMDLHDGCVRLSIGIEDYEDIEADLANALKTIK